MRSLPLICILALSAAPALATAPEVPSNAPFLVLADNLDEPKGHIAEIDDQGEVQLHEESCASSDHRARRDSSPVDHKHPPR